jgi:hypothetical protein
VKMTHSTPDTGNNTIFCVFLFRDVSLTGHVSDQEKENRATNTEIMRYKGTQRFSGCKRREHWSSSLARSNNGETGADGIQKLLSERTKRSFKYSF